MGWMIAGILIIIIVIRVVYELHHIKVTEYQLHSAKLEEGSGLRIVFLSDLHLRNYGHDNDVLLRLVEEQKPDLVLLGGDMTVDSPKKNEAALYPLLKALVRIAPVYYAPGNHERVLKENIRFESDRFDKLMALCKECGIAFLSNQMTFPALRTGGTGQGTLESSLQQSGIPQALCIAGLDPEYEFYNKRKKRKLTKKDLEEKLGRPDEAVYTILLAHDPGPFAEYVEYGADLVLAGHYHGGAIRIGNKGVVSPQVRFFPPYSAGRFEKDRTVMIVTRGAGSHSVNLRLFNYPEIVLLKFSGIRKCDKMIPASQDA